MKPIIKILKNPRITEKASFHYEQNVYTFDVADSANKTEIKKAIFELYKVHPVKVNILAVPERRITLRGRQNQKGGGKKALVYLKAGDKIEFL
ncbi:50S ribosomal protein L23 [Candidatus Nomurabacteria bacterium RIFCSPLOWO2_01_FULL_41_21]|uniref:Large ribosomal subunit protein uL23 n=2 Tax=Candidatus Nomuraibacteriota TaxID=1752729 RepID=A0A1F6V3G3_9BACT|nr:MAG: 50S ribosomal protein L23 [Candidatus Nomurabacteria bacterium RIFCSPHIGHO2_01_FULL_40_20]OGI88367.1 MAG: 50S ribosomal protein L23 [Candidatus Nomurabacteria bacterium RIFCSPLOWO2_01_FULL_41_21]